MKYLIIGAGGTGGAIGAHMARAGKDITFIARGEHLDVMRRNGLLLIKPNETFIIENIPAYTMDEYEDVPDVILVCVKGYSLKEVIPFIKRIAGVDTVVIPILNIYGTGRQMQMELPGLLVTDGCMYIASEVSEPGTILMRGDILRIVFGVREKEEYRSILKEIERDLLESRIRGILSEDIRKDALLKFSYVSAQSACGAYYDVPVGAMQKPGEIRDCFATLVHEIDILAQAMGVYFEEDIVSRNLKILDDLESEMTTSMQRDLRSGRRSEIDGQIYEVVRLGKEYQLELPMYEKISVSLQRKHEKE